MPLPSSTNNIPLTTPTCVGAWIDYPFRDDGDSETKVYNHKMQVALSSYAPLNDNDTMTTATNKPVRSPFDDDSDAYYVGDTPPTSIDGLMVEFVRSFANVPINREDPNGFYAFEFPIVPGGIQISKPTISESSSYNTSTFVLTITSTLSSLDAENFNDGDIVSIYNPNTWSYELGYGYTGYRSRFTGPCTKSGDVITLKIYNFFWSDAGTPTAYSNFTDNNPSNYDVEKTISGERSSPSTINSSSVLSIRYVKSSAVSQISLGTKFELLTSTGDVTNTTSDTTIPFTTTEWQNAALAGEYIAAENETISKWRGNIYEVSQIMVKMQ